jgi:hypothetical protein
MAAVYSLLVSEGRLKRKTTNWIERIKRFEPDRADALRMRGSLHFPPSPLGESLLGEEVPLSVVSGRSLCLCRRHLKTGRRSGRTVDGRTAA